MSPSQDACKHHINLNEACPWCDRKAARGFPIRKPWQFYQGHFTAFTQELAEEGVEGPLAVVVLVEDANGKVLAYRRGPEDRLRILTECFAETLQERKEASCFADKLKTGFGKLFN